MTFAIKWKVGCSPIPRFAKILQSNQIAELLRNSYEYWYIVMKTKCMSVI